MTRKQKRQNFFFGGVLFSFGGLLSAMAATWITPWVVATVSVICMCLCFFTFWKSA